MKIDKTSTMMVNKLSKELEDDLIGVFKVIQSDFLKSIDTDNFSELKLEEMLDKYFGHK